MIFKNSFVLLDRNTLNITRSIGYFKLLLQNFLIQAGNKDLNVKANDLNWILKIYFSIKNHIKMFYQSVGNNIFCYMLKVRLVQLRCVSLI